MDPEINVTPLIDILLVLLIIFMVSSPLKSAQFEAKVPSQNIDNLGKINPLTFVVRINADSSLALNKQDLGNINEPTKLSNRLSQVFSERLENRTLNENLENHNNLTIKRENPKKPFS